MALFVRLFAQKVTAKSCPVVRLVSMVNHQNSAKPNTSSGADDSTLKKYRCRSHKIKPKPPGTKALYYKLVMKSQTKNHKRSQLTQHQIYKLKRAPEWMESVPHSSVIQTKPRWIKNGLFVYLQTKPKTD